MTSGNLTPVLRNSKALASPGRRRAWLRLPCALLLGLALLAAGCQKDPSSIGVGLPSAQANTGAYLIDTLTIRASTVLRDSVVTSGSDYLLAGRYTRPPAGHAHGQELLPPERAECVSARPDLRVRFAHAGAQAGCVSLRRYHQNADPV